MDTNIGDMVKSFGVKVAKAVESAANTVAESANKHVDKLNLDVRRREIMSGFGEKCYGMWKNGTQFPEELDKMLREVAEIDDKLASYVPVKPAEKAEENSEAKEEEETAAVEEIAEAIEDSAPEAEENETAEVPVIRVDEPEEKETSVE